MKLLTGSICQNETPPVICPARQTCCRSWFRLIFLCAACCKTISDLPACTHGPSCLYPRVKPDLSLVPPIRICNASANATHLYIHARKLQIALCFCIFEVYTILFFLNIKCLFLTVLLSRGVAGVACHSLEPPRQCANAFREVGTLWLCSKKRQLQRTSTSATTK